MKQKVDTSEVIKVVPAQSRIRWAVNLTGMRMPGSGTGDGRRLGLIDLARIAIKDKTSVFTTPAIITEIGVACKPSKDAGFTFMKWDEMPWTPIPGDDQIMYFIEKQIMLFLLAAPDIHESEQVLKERRDLFLLLTGPVRIKRTKAIVEDKKELKFRRDKGQMAAALEKLERDFIQTASARGFTITNTIEYPPGMERLFS